MERGEWIRQWAEQAAQGVRYKPDRAETVRELTDHMEDKMETLMARGMPPEEAERRAVEAMGDPAEVSAGLAKAHRCWLGYCYQASKAARIVALVALLIWFGRAGPEILLPWHWPLVPLSVVDQLVCELPPETQQPLFEDPLYWPSWPADGQRGEVTAVNGGGASSERGVSVRQAALCRWPQEEGIQQSLCVQIEAITALWDDVSDEVLAHIWTEDSTGRRFDSQRQALEDPLLWMERGVSVLEGWRRRTPWSHTGVLFVPEVDGASWVDLHYDYFGSGFVLRVELPRGGDQ